MRDPNDILEVLEDLQVKCLVACAILVGVATIAAVIFLLLHWCGIAV